MQSFSIPLEMPTEKLPSYERSEFDAGSHTCGLTSKGLGLCWASILDKDPKIKSKYLGPDCQGTGRDYITLVS